MNLLLVDTVRRMIPRWRDAETTSRLGELGPLRKVQREVPDGALREKLVDWVREPSLFIATDIVGTALLTRDSAADSNVAEVARAVLNDEASTSLARRAAERLLYGERSREFLPLGMTRTQAYQRIGDLRRLLHRDLRNAIAWVDLAHLYTLVGQPRQARDAIRIALSLAPDSRHVLRSATRFYVHNDERDTALSLLRRSDRTRYDPWLIAAEVGVSGLAETSPRFAKTGLSLAWSGSFSPRDLAEMAAAIGTLESEHGNQRKAKRLFNLSMEDPNDNALAQAAWAARATQSVEVDPSNIKVPFSFEARARINFTNQDFEAALRESEAWLNDQRFSVGAAAFASYVAAVVLAEHEQAIAVLDAALVANPDDWTLRNNLAFSLASLDRVKEARAVFRSLTSDDETPARRGVWLATSGLLEFRDGDPTSGKRLYEEAISIFERERLTSLRAIAAVFKAREEIRARTSTAAGALQRAREFVAKGASPELETVLAQLDDPSSNQLSLPS